MFKNILFKILFLLILFSNNLLNANDVGSMINIAGISILKSSKQHVISEYFTNYLLSEQSQLYFATETFEYPLVKDIEVQGPQKPLSELNSPDIDLSKLEDLQNTIALLNKAELL